MRSFRPIERYEDGTRVVTLVYDATPDVYHHELAAIRAIV